MASRSLSSLMRESGHDRLTRAGVIGEQEAQSRLRQHLQIDRLDLVGQGANARQADRKLAVVGVGETNTSRLDQESQPFRIRGLHRYFLFLFRTENGSGLLGGYDRLLECAIGQSNSALITGRPVRTEGSGILQDDRYVEVSR